jgi:Tfp pilus assembly protein PilN
MINLLPPELKIEIAYAKRNAIMVRYIMLTVAIAVVLTGAFIGSHLYLNQRLSDTAASIASKDTIAASYKTVETEAKTLNSRVAAIKAIQDSQPKFSAVLSDLAKTVPKDVSISGLTLTGIDSTPVTISADAVTYQSAVDFRDALAASPRISGADIGSITGSAAAGFHVDITIGFKPGEAK